MEQQRYQGMGVRESDAQTPAESDAPAIRWPAPLNGNPDAFPAGPIRERSVAPTNLDDSAASTPPRIADQPAANVTDAATPDDQITLLAERQPGASAFAAPVPQRNGRHGSLPPAPPITSGSNSATLSDAPIPWIPPRVTPPARAIRPTAPERDIREQRHVPWQAAESWGPVTFTIEATTAAGASYLFWWVSGLLIYFNERHNRYVRFHAMQSILLTGALTVVGVVGFIVSALCGDLASATGRHAYNTLGAGIGALTIASIVFPWLFAMIAAWTGNYLRLPIVGHYAERYAAPPIEPTPPPLY